MQALIKFNVIITLAALSLSLAWTAEGNSFVAEAELDGFNVVPPVLTSKTTDEGCLEFKSQPSTTVTGETLALVAGNPWTIRVRQPMNQVSERSNIRLYFGQHFANGRPIATLCDNDISNLECGDKDTQIPTDLGFQLNDIRGEFPLSDIQFQGQQVDFCCDTATIAGVTLVRTEEDMEKDRLELPNDENGLEVIKALIERGLIYVVINSKFKASLKSGEIIGYRPRRGVIDGDGEIRGTLRLALKGFRCPPPPESAPNE